MTASVKDIFFDALDVPTADRAAWLAANCADEDCRRQVLELLAAHDVAPTFAPPKAAASSLGGSATAQPLEADGDVIGDGKYELLRRLGEGGFGVVYLAKQNFPVERPVAIKLLKIAMDGSQIAARFEAERQTLARMDHPLIARVFDAGTTGRGRPYFVMEFVDGRPITEFCIGRRMLLVERFQLFAQVCLAVQHAHGKGVIHRDLKPGNILVSVVDGVPTPKVIDFGIAKAVDPLGDEGGLAPQMTLEAQIIGTPQYMAPEQATIGPKQVDTRSDIYSLGTVLYELIAGSPPFDPAELRHVGLDEVCRIIRERAPTRPSTRIANDDQSAFEKRTRLRRLVAGEVDWIVMRALEKEPDRRYQTAAELAEDLRRFVRHEPVHARPPSRSYAARKFIRRHRPEVALASLAIAALLGVAIVATVKEREARSARDLAQRNEAIAVVNAERARAAEARAVAEAEQAAAELRRADAIATFARRLLGGIGPGVSRGRDTALLKDLLDVASQKVDASLAQTPTIDLLVRTMVAQAQYDLGDFDRAAGTLRPAFERTRETVRDAPERLRAGTLLATILSESGDAKSALAVSQETVDGYGRAGGPPTGDWLSARVGLASAQRRARQFDEALKTDEAVLAELVAEGEGDGELALRVRNAIATLLVDLKRPLEALARWEDVLSIQQRRHGANHPGTLATMGNLAVVYDRTGQTARAERYSRLVLEEERRLYQPGHPNLVKSLNNLAAVLLTLDRVDEAASLLDEACAISAAKPASTKRYVRPLMAQTAELRMRQRMYDQALAIATALRDDYAAEYGERSPRTISTVTVLLGCLADAGRFAEAGQVLDALGLDRLPEDLADDQRATFHATAAQVLFGLGRDAEARQSLAIARSLAKPVAEGGALVARRLARVDAATRPTGVTTR